MIPILVTGGAGYIGSHAAKALYESGFLPIVYDNLSTGHAKNVRWGPFIEGELSNQALLRYVFQTHRPQAVLHFAAKALVAESMQDPAIYYRNNVADSLSLLEVMKEEGVFSLIFSSTCATYGNPQFTPLTELHPQVPISPYGRSKKMVEEILFDFEKAYGIRSIKLRYFNVAGAQGEIGEEHDPETHLIPLVIQSALGKKEAVSIYGTDFPTPDGSAIRDYLHVVDLASAHVLALKWLLHHQSSQEVNLGTGQGASVFEIIDAVEKLSPQKIPSRHLPKREGDPTMLTASYEKALSLFGWKPSYSLEETIRSAWDWEKRR